MMQETKSRDKSERIKIAFIINPMSGTTNKDFLPELIRKTLDKNKFDITIVRTEYAGHGKELAAYFVSEKYQCVVACGGDGTMNEVASALVDTRIVFGIIPFGSGNGLARTLGVPMDAEEAIKLINEYHLSYMDYGIAGEHKFFCTCGTGFDAHISHEFSKDGKRGFWTYFKVIVREFWDYKSDTYTLTSGNAIISQRAFLVTFANAAQYGNNAFIAPNASIRDGMVDICVLKPFSFFAIPYIAWCLFTKKMERCWHMTFIRATEITLERTRKGEFHIDGDPVVLTDRIPIKIVQDGLRVVCSSEEPGGLLTTALKRVEKRIKTRKLLDRWKRKESK